MSQAEFSAAYHIPLASLRQYEIGRHMPSPGMRAYLKVIAADRWWRRGRGGRQLRTN